MRQVFLDTETTGLSPDAGDRVIEVGCVEMINRRLSGRNLHFYVNPERPNSADALRIHGLSDEFLADKPVFATIVDELLEYLAGAEVIIHNAGFDVGFLEMELRRAARAPLAEHVAGVVDSLAIAREMFPGKSNSLDALCRRLEVDHSNRSLHGALLDAGLLAEVYIRLTRGQESLVIDAMPDDAAAESVAAVDFSSLQLMVLQPDAGELEAHAKLIEQIDADSGGKAVWRRVVA